MSTLLNGQSTIPFNIQTIPDKTPYNEKIAKQVREQSRKKYARPRKSIEEELYPKTEKDENFSESEED